MEIFFQLSSRLPFFGSHRLRQLQGRTIIVPLFIKLQPVICRLVNHLKAF